MAVVALSDKVGFIEKAFGPGKLSRNCVNMDVRCPMCAPADAMKRKLSIRVDDDRNHCWTCGWRARSLAPLIRRYVPGLLREYVERFMPAGRSPWASVGPNAVQGVSLPPDFRLLAAADASDPAVRRLLKYLASRGVTSSMAWRYRLGLSRERRWRDRVLVPSFDRAGEVNYFVARACDARSRPRYDAPDADRLPIIFNDIDIDWSRRITLCEGVFDMFKCGENAVPLLGSDLTEESAVMNAIVAHGTPVALALDADMWATKTLRSARLLSSYDIDVVIVDTRPFGDPGCASRDQVMKAISEARALDWGSAFSRRLEAAIASGPRRRVPARPAAL